MHKSSSNRASRVQSDNTHVCVVLLFLVYWLHWPCGHLNVCKSPLPPSRSTTNSSEQIGIRHKLLKLLPKFYFTRKKTIQEKCQGGPPLSFCPQNTDGAIISLLSGSPMLATPEVAEDKPAPACFGLHAVHSHEVS